VQAVESDLAAAGLRDTPLGAIAVELAKAIGDPFASGSAIAALSKELRSVMAAALGVGDRGDDPLDELKRRRDRKPVIH
jgi:hypothetical protein